MVSMSNICIFQNNVNMKKLEKVTRFQIQTLPGF